MRMFTRLVAFVLFAFVVAGNVSAQTPSRFDWKFYDRAPLVVTTNHDDVTVVRIFSGDEGDANRVLAENGTCLVFFGTEKCDPAFIGQVVDYLREGKWQRKEYPQGNTDLSYPLAHGVVVKGVRKAMVTKDPAVIHTVDKTGKRVNPIARLLEPLQVATGPNAGKWVRVVIFEECYNVSGENSSPPPPPPAPRVTTAPTPSPEPTPRAPRAPRVRPIPVPVYTPPPAKTIEKEEGLNVGAHVGIGGLYGWWKETYQCDNPSKCDADQMHQTAALYLTGGGNIGRAFFEGSASIWDKDYRIRFDDPIPKRREQEETSDLFWTAEGGYEHPLSDDLRLRAGLRMDFYRVHDHYFSPRETSIEQDYKTFGFMGGVRGGDDTAGYVVEGFYEPWGNRDKTGTQAGFPDSHDATQNAKAYGFDGHVDFGVAEHVGVFVGAGWTHRSSYRPGPASNAGNEQPNLLAIFGGVQIHF